MAARRRRIRVHFENRGQACLWWDLEPPAGRAGHWTVIAASAESWLWEHSQIARNSVAVGKRPGFIGVFAKRFSHCIPIVRIEPVETQQHRAARAATAARTARAVTSQAETA